MPKTETEKLYYHRKSKQKPKKTKVLKTCFKNSKMTLKKIIKAYNQLYKRPRTQIF